MTTAVEIEAYYPTTDKLKELYHIEEFGLFCSFEEFEDIARILWHMYRKNVPKQAIAEPVAWLIATELQDGTKRTYAATGEYKHVKDACDFGEPIPLYTSPKVPKQITSEDITNQMYAEWNKIFGNWDSPSPSDSEIMAAAYNAINAYLEHK